MEFQSISAKRRDGQQHTQEDLVALAEGASELVRNPRTASVKEYQLAAWLMAAYLNPLDADETAWLTTAMADSGERLDLTGLPKPWVDKHSTGGVGDKTSIVLLPLLASCGLTVVKMSGKGLGITGGTVDKLGAIPGFKLDLSIAEMKEQARSIGLALTGQTPDLAPADKELYALRDATATVSSIPLIVSSILSKKLAGGAETVVLDVKCGSGAFMKSFEAATELADSLTRTATLCGLKTRIAITDMDQPLGSAAGNALEVLEAIRVLSGEQSRFSRLCIELAGLTLEASGLQPDRASGETQATAAIRSGAAKEKARQWFNAQGASSDVIADPSVLPQAPYVLEINHEGDSGWISKVDAEAVGNAIVALGGGRRAKDDVIDLSVGIVTHVEVGSHAASGQILMTIHAADRNSAQAARESLQNAIKFSKSEVARREPILKVV